MSATIRCVLTVLLLLVSAASGQTTTTTTTAPAEDPAAVMAAEFATFGVKVAAPESWKRLPEDGPQMMAKWSAPGADGKISAYVAIDLEPARGKNARGFADDLATRTGGESRAESSGLGEEPTWRVVFPKATVPQGIAAKELLVAVHGEYIYRMTGFQAVDGADVSGALEELRRNFSYTEMSRPSSARGVRAEPITILNRLRMKPAATLRPKEARNDIRGRAIEMQIFNFRSGRADLVMTTEIDVRPGRMTLENLGKGLIGQMSLREDPDKPIKWKKLDGPTPRIITNSFDGVKSGSKTLPLRFALIELGDRDVALLGFVFPSGDPVEQETFEDLSEAMTASVEPLKK